MKLIYLLGIRFYSFFIRIASLWNKKAQLWMQGREDVWQEIADWKRMDLPVYWFHCASLGEFEQGRPIIEALKREKECQIVITFFSPSGYEIRKNYELADLVIYLPRETSKNVKRFLSIIKPQKAFFIKYEFWAAYIIEAQRLGVELISVSAVFRKKQIFFKFYGGFMRKVLQQFDYIFVQDDASKKQLETISVEAITAGDTRYDRVMENSKKVKSYPEIESFVGGDKVLVVGSSWSADDEILQSVLNNVEFDWKVIIAPHEINSNRLNAVEKAFDKSVVRYSAIEDGEDLKTKSILLIDNIGMLMNVYQYADLAYVGGAFGSGLHNILEPASFGVPVIFGKDYAKFVEAFDFIKHNVGFSVSDEMEFKKTFKKLSNLDFTNKVSEFMKTRGGATDIILSRIQI